MQEIVYRVIGVLCAVVAGTPVGTNLGLVHLLWMLVSGRLLETRGAVIPGLTATGLPEPGVRRAWAALGHGAWSTGGLLASWRAYVEQAGEWHVHEYEGYRPVAVDVTGFWRPRLQGLATSHYHGPAGKALPAIPVGMVARIGSVGTQRLGLPLALVRADLADPGTAAHERALVRAAVQAMAAQDALVLDAGFEIRQLQEAGAQRYVVRTAKNSTGRRAVPPAYPGRGRPRRRGELIRPLARTYRGRTLAATRPDQSLTWHEGDAIVRADWWDDLVLADVPSDRATFRLVVIHDSRWTEPLVLATTLSTSARALRDLYLDRWPVEQLPLAAKQVLGAARSFVSETETCQRLPALALLAGSLLTYLAATQPAIPTGSWDRRPRPTPGRLRRVLARAFSQLPSHCRTGFAKKPPSPPTCRPAPGVSNTLARPPHPLRAHLTRRWQAPTSPDLPETKVSPRDRLAACLACYPPRATTPVELAGAHA